MPSFAARLAALSRPPMLVRAARVAAALERKRGQRLSASARDRERLIDEEAALDAARRAGDTAYSPSRHVQLLARLLAAASQEPRAP
ncbi:MAG: DUF6477 family protein [Pseudomonadota bacterium]